MIKSFIKLFSLGIPLLWQSQLIAQTGELPLSSEPGKCYARCLVGAEYEQNEIAIPIYLGDDQKIIESYVKDTSFMPLQERTEWVQKEVEKKNKSKGVGSELVWCLVEREPEEVFIEFYLTDTSVTDDFEIEYFVISELEIEGGFTEWLEVVCADKIKVQLINEIRNALGMTTESDSPSLDPKTKGFLTKYQKNNNLPVGNLDFKTLEHLGVHIQ